MFEVQHFDIAFATHVFRWRLKERGVTYIKNYFRGSESLLQKSHTTSNIFSTPPINTKVSNSLVYRCYVGYMSK